VVNKFSLGFVSCLLLFGCAGFTFRYYGLSGVSYSEGVLLGPKAKDDLPFSACAPNGESKNPCVVMFAKEFFALKLDYEDAKQKLKECQKP
jgi:hypothetical protein